MEGLHNSARLEKILLYSRGREYGKLLVRLSRFGFVSAGKVAIPAKLVRKHETEPKTFLSWVQLDFHADASKLSDA